jgi:hypothetical protein
MHPQETLSRVLSFCNLPVSELKISKTCETINPGRLDNSKHYRVYKKEIDELSDTDILELSGYTKPMIPNPEKANLLA